MQAEILCQGPQEGFPHVQEGSLGPIRTTLPFSSDVAEILTEQRGETAHIEFLRLVRHICFLHILNHFISNVEKAGKPAASRPSTRAVQAAARFFVVVFCPAEAAPVSA